MLRRIRQTDLTGTIPVNQRCHRIVSFLRLDLTKISGTLFTIIYAPKYPARFKICPAGQDTGGLCKQFLQFSERGFPCGFPPPCLLLAYEYVQFAVMLFFPAFICLKEKIHFTDDIRSYFAADVFF